MILVDANLLTEFNPGSSSRACGSSAFSCKILVRFSALVFVRSAEAGWPAVQRYDYVVRVRALAAQDLPALVLLSRQRTREYHETVRFALRELTARESGVGR